MKLYAPLGILHDKFNEMDFLRYAMKSKEIPRLKDFMMTTGTYSNLMIILCNYIEETPTIKY